MTPLLQVRQLTMTFGGLNALTEVGFEVAAGSITALIGPNGAGKTTLFNCLTGFYLPSRGAIQLHLGPATLDLVQLLGGPFQVSDFTQPRRFANRLRYKLFGGSHRVARAGVARTFQNIRLFRDMTVLENLLVAQHRLVNRNPLAGLLRTPAFRRAEEQALARAGQWLDVCGLREEANRLAGELPYGLQRKLEVARAMCTQPRLLCLDEPAAGLNPRETDEVARLIRHLRDHHQVTILLIEHDMGLVMEVSDQVVVLDHGEVIAQGRPAEVKSNPKVLEAYLGE